MSVIPFNRLHIRVGMGYPPDREQNRHDNDARLAGATLYPAEAISLVSYSTHGFVERLTAPPAKVEVMQLLGITNQAPIANRPTIVAPTG
jgi:hypothetical protein